MKTLIIPIHYAEDAIMIFARDEKEFIAKRFHQFIANTDHRCTCEKCLIAFVQREWMQRELKRNPELAHPMKFAVAFKGCEEMMNRLMDIGCPSHIAPVEAVNGYLRGVAVKNAVATGYTAKEAVAELASKLGLSLSEVEVHTVGIPKGSSFPPVLDGANMPEMKGRPDSPHDAKLADILNSMEQKATPRE